MRRLAFLVLCSLLALGPAHGARVFDSTDYIRINSAAVDYGDAGAVVAWATVDNTTTVHSVFNATSQEDAGTGYQYLIQFRGDDYEGHTDRVRNWNSNSGNSAWSSTSYSASTWHHVAMGVNSTTSFTAFLDGGGKDEDTSTITDVSPVWTYIGATGATTQNHNGKIALVTVWNAGALGDANMAELGAGRNPLTIGQFPAYHLSLDGGVVDEVSGTAWTDNGTADAERPALGW